MQALFPVPALLTIIYFLFAIFFLTELAEPLVGSHPAVPRNPHPPHSSPPLLFFILTLSPFLSLFLLYQHIVASRKARVDISETSYVGPPDV